MMAMSDYPRDSTQFDVANGERSSAGPCAEGVPLPSWKSKSAQVHSVDVLPSYKSALSMSLSSLPELEPYKAMGHQSRTLGELPSMHTPSSHLQWDNRVDVDLRMRTTKTIPGRLDESLDDVPRRASSYAEGPCGTLQSSSGLGPAKRSHMPKATIWTHFTATTLDEMSQAPYSRTMDSLPASEAWTPMGTMDALPKLGMEPPSRLHEGGFAEAITHSYVYGQPEWRYQPPRQVYPEGCDHSWEMDVTRVRLTPPAEQQELLNQVLQEQLVMDQGGLPRNPVVDYGLYVFGMLDTLP